MSRVGFDVGVGVDFAGDLVRPLPLVDAALGQITPRTDIASSMEVLSW